MKHVITPARRVVSKGSLLAMELELPEISVEVPTAAQVAGIAARIVSRALADGIKAGRDVNGSPLRTPAASTLRRRAYDAFPPVNPRSDRWIKRYPGRAKAFAGGKVTAGRIKTRTTKTSERSGWRRVTRYKTANVSSLAGVDSGTLWQRIKANRSSGGTAYVDAPPERPIADIERRLGAQIFAATEKHLSDALTEATKDVFRGWR